MKKIIAVSTLVSLLTIQSSMASDCHVGFKIKNAIFQQELKNSTAREFSLKDYHADQFKNDQLSFEAERIYDKRGRYEKCELKNIRYADERFSRVGTTIKKGLVGTGLFTAGVATIGLTLAYLYAEAQGPSAQKTLLDDSADKSIDKGVYVYVTTYDHLDPYYYGPIVYRRDYRIHHPYYHYHYMSAHEYHRMRTAELGLIMGTLLIVEAFQVPRQMRSTNFHGPAEKMIGENECDVATIKEKLLFDQYLYCGDFRKDAAQDFYAKENTVRDTLGSAMANLKRGKFSNLRKLLTREASARFGSDSELEQLRQKYIMNNAQGFHDIVAVDGKSPTERVQKVTARVGNMPVELLCTQKWSYQRSDLFNVGADFIPLNRYENCSINAL